MTSRPRLQGRLPLPSFRRRLFPEVLAALWLLASESLSMDAKLARILSDALSALARFDEQQLRQPPLLPWLKLRQRLLAAPQGLHRRWPA